MVDVVDEMALIRFKHKLVHVRAAEHCEASGEAKSILSSLDTLQVAGFT